MIPKFIMLCGLPASGKSTKAKIFAEEHNAIIFSSDALREEMFGDINHQDNNQELFIELHRRIKDCLKNGKSAIYDACNISYKRRMAFLAELTNIPCKKICILMATPYEECLKRNSGRERNVPEYVIERMYMNFNIPYWYEGWDHIEIEYSEGSQSSYGLVSQWLDEMMNYNQENSHHQLSLGGHMRSAVKYIQNNSATTNNKHDLTLRGATMLHDCGKPFCKTFINSRGEITSEAHYYSHQYCGAYNSLFFSYLNEFVDHLDIAIIIMWHMQPYFNKEEKTKNKYRKLWGEELYQDIMKLHEADKAAH